MVHQVFQDFLSSYEMHVQLEEDVLFPMYEERPETSPEPTDSLREDHAQIFRLGKNIQDLLARGDWEGVPHDVSLLYQALIRHHEKEEEMFLPMASDSLLSDKDKIIAELERRASV
jgi:iron-sulfur cluster repair protein YtfE (RIC family)